jgi:predicted dehydrogenase
MGLRFGLFGTGYWAEQTQGAALAAHGDVELVGVWGRDAEKSGRLAHRYGVAAYAEADALIADVDAVAVALPPDVQAGIAIRAAEAGRHLLLDKPLAFGLEDADRIVALVAERRLASVVFFTNRFYRNVAAFLAETAAAGGWHGARALMFASILQPGNPYAASAWRRERGGLWDIAPHTLSLIVPVLGRVTEVSAMAAPRATTHLLLRHEGGAVSSLAVTLDAPPVASAFETAFHGERGMATVPAPDGSPVEAFAVAIDELIRAAALDEPEHPCDVRFGREVVAVLTAAARARDEGRTMSVPQDPHYR